MWDEGTRVYVNLQPHFREQVCGLCGDFDGNALNDYRARQGELNLTTTMKVLSSTCFLTHFQIRLFCDLVFLKTRITRRYLKVEVLSDARVFTHAVDVSIV